MTSSDSAATSSDARASSPPPGERSPSDDSAVTRCEALPRLREKVYGSAAEPARLVFGP